MCAITIVHVDISFKFKIECISRLSLGSWHPGHSNYYIIIIMAKNFHLTKILPI